MFQRSWGQFPALYTGWTFFTYICCKNCNDVCLKRPKINNKRPGLAHQNKLKMNQLITWEKPKIRHKRGVFAYVSCSRCSHDTSAGQVSAFEETSLLRRRSEQHF